MSRKKIKLDERFCGVHRAEWLRIANDLPDTLYGRNCVSCHFVECDKCEACVLGRVRVLADERLSRLHTALFDPDSVDDYPF